MEETGTQTEEAPAPAEATAASAAPRPPSSAPRAPGTSPDHQPRLLPCRPRTAGAGVTGGTCLTDRTPMVLSFNPDPRLRSWQRLEHMRLHRMGLSSKLSRRYNVARSLDFQPVGLRLPEPPSSGVWLPAEQQDQLNFYATLARKKNEVAPFKTFQKPTCGAFFSRDTDNKKIKHDLEPTDVIKWRYFL